MVRVREFALFLSPLEERIRMRGFALFLPLPWGRGLGRGGYDYIKPSKAINNRIGF
jgi:hypothetical protein